MAPETLRLSLRSTRGPDGAPVYDQVDPDRLTPAGRALLRALQQPHASLDIPLRSRRTRREMGMRPGPFLTEEDLDQPVKVSWRGWSRYPADSAMDVHEYLDREAMKLDPEYEVADGEPYPARMTIGQVLAYLNARGRAITAATWRAYVARDQAPRPGEHVGRTPLWDADEVRAWAARGV